MVESRVGLELVGRTSFVIVLLDCLKRYMQVGERKLVKRLLPRTKNSWNGSFETVTKQRMMMFMMLRNLYCVFYLILCEKIFIYLRF